METITNFLDGLALGPWLRAAITVVASIVLAKVAEIIMTRLLAQIASRTTTDLDDEAIRILKRPVFLTVLFVGLGVAAIQLGMGSRLESFTTRLLRTFVILVWMGAVFRLTSLLFDSSNYTRGRMKFIDRRTVPLFNNLIKIGAVAAAVYFVMTVWHIDATAWLASAGIVGIAVGFAAKDTLANLLAGVFILADSPYKVGDFVNLDTGERGQVSHIGLRSTRLITRDDIEVTIPNGVMGAAKIVNETSGRWPRERLRVPVGVAYGSDIDKVSEILLEAGAECDLVCQDPDPLVRFRAFGESSLDFELLVWIEEPVFRGKTLHVLNTAIYKKFAKNDVQIPFPQRDLHVKSMPAPPKT